MTMGKNLWKRRSIQKDLIPSVVAVVWSEKSFINLNLVAEKNVFWRRLQNFTLVKYKALNCSSSVHAGDDNLFNPIAICLICILAWIFFCCCWILCYNVKYWKMPTVFPTSFSSWKINDGMSKNQFLKHIPLLPLSFSFMCVFSLVAISLPNLKDA